ncbi:hypothetical protein OCA16_23935 [Bacillus cereus]|nr:hypothetical protein [Bacillus cereus]
MGDILKNARPIWKRTWFRYLGAFFYCSVTVYPALTGSKTPTSKFSESEEVRWGMNKTPTD